MYHIANDKRQICTCEKIVDGLKACLSVKNMTEIGVSDICTAAGVSRSSFYRSFDMPLDVLSYACKKVVDMIVNDFSNADLANGDDLIQFSLNYWRKHTDILEAAINCDRMDIVQRAIDNHSDRFIGDLMGYVKKGFTKAEIDYISMGCVGLISNLLTVWIRHGKKETPDQLFALYKKCREVVLGIHSGELAKKLGL